MANNMFSGLEQLGLGDMSNLDVFEEEKKKEAGSSGQSAVKEVKEEDLLYDKTYTCPLCDSEFKVKAVRVGKNKIIGSDSDLRARYNYVDPIKYDSIVCNHCGYTALIRYFKNSSTAQLKLIKENISSKFRGVDETAPVYSYDEAIVRFQLALANAIVKKANDSEKAFIILKLAWLLRGKAEGMPTDMENYDEAVKDLKVQEHAYIEKAYEGFKRAIQKESFPMCGMDEYTVIYLTADLARQCKDYSIAMKLLGEVITSKQPSQRLKDKARDMKDMIRKEENKQ